MRSWAVCNPRGNVGEDARRPCRPKVRGIPTATEHDLRRTVGTNLARLGVSKDIRARILNHVEGARSVTDAVYNQHEFWAEKRVALLLWETELRRIIGS